MSRIRNVSPLRPCLLASVAAILLAPCAHADVIYNDTTTFSGQVYASGGAALVNGSEATVALLDDITAGAGTVGDGVTSISFVAANLNSTAVTTGVTLLAYSADGIGGGPGTLLGEFQTQTLTLSASSVGLETYTSATPLFTVPSGLFWLGISYNNEDGTLPVTAAQLNNLGLGIYNPPTVGSSQDAFFLANSASSLGTTDPAGGFFFFGGNPVANFGLELQGSAPGTIAATPEPSSISLLLLGAASIGGFARRLRRQA